MWAACPMALQERWCLLLLDLVAVVGNLGLGVSPRMIGLFGVWTILGLANLGGSSLGWTMCWPAMCASWDWCSMRSMIGPGQPVAAMIVRTRMSVVEASVLVVLADWVVSVVVVPWIVVMDWFCWPEPESVTASAVVGWPCPPLKVVVVCHLR